MKLTNMTAQRLLGGLRNIDAAEATKLDGEVRLKIAININRLMPEVLAYQNTQDKLNNEKNAARAKAMAPTPMNGEVIGALQTLGEIDEQIRVIAETIEDHKLKKLTKDELKLKENSMIKADVIAAVAPIIKEFDDGESDE